MLVCATQRASAVWGFWAVAALSGCAAIVGGTGPQKIKVASNPPGATVIVDGRPCAMTPAVVRLDRTVPHQILVEKAGYMPVEADLKSKINPWIFGNVVAGGLIGIAVDLVTDSDRRLSPGKVNVQLSPAGEATSRQ